jgi:hypothetical protein
MLSPRMIFDVFKNGMYLTLEQVAADVLEDRYLIRRLDVGGLISEIREGVRWEETP